MLCTRDAGTDNDEMTRLVILHLCDKVAVVQGCHGFFKQFREFVICDVFTFVESFVLGQELVINSIPVKSQATLIVPNSIVLVEGFPQHLELSCKTFLCIPKGQSVVDGIVL